MASGAETRTIEAEAGAVDASAAIVRSGFQAGLPDHPVHVDRLEPAAPVTGRPALLMIHGGFHTGACFLATPDGRPGWAPYFAARGHRVFVLDWPGHGRSPAVADLATMSSRAMAAALAAVLLATGPVVLLAHSAGGPFAWWLAEQDPERVLGIVGIAPGPPPSPGAAAGGGSAGPAASAAAVAVAPAELDFDGRPGPLRRADPSRPVRVAPAFIRHYWTNAPQFPAEAFDAYAAGITAESATLLNERFGLEPSGIALRDPAGLSRLPILIVTGEHDPRHPRALDEATARQLGARFVWLPDAGLRGNGHLPMIERNSDAVAALIATWLNDFPQPSRVA